MTETILVEDYEGEDLNGLTSDEIVAILIEADELDPKVEIDAVDFEATTRSYRPKPDDPWYTARIYLWVKP
jgi:hypothetical protein